MNFLCYDIDETLIRFSVVDSDGLVQEEGETLTPTTNCKNSIPEKLIETSLPILNRVEIEAVGISTIGQVDISTGKVLFARNTIHNYAGCQLADTVDNGLNKPVFVENCARCACLGEMWKGAGRNYRNFVNLKIGKRVSGAVVFDNQLLSGRDGITGDFGNLSVRSAVLNSPNRFDYLGSTSSLLGRLKKMSGQDVNLVEFIDLVEEYKGDAPEVYRDYLDSLSQGIMSIVCILNPEVVIIGGGISSECDFFIDDLNKLIIKKSENLQQSATQVIQAELEDCAEIMGAAYICKSRSNL